MPGWPTAGRPGRGAARTRTLRRVTDWSALTVGILGPLQVANAGTPVPLPGRTERAVVVALAARAGHPATSTALGADVWGESSGDGNGQNLVVTVSRVRQRLVAALGPAARDLVETVPGGYRLAVDPHLVDATRFADLVAEGRRLVPEGAESAAAARDRVSQALALWRGDPLVDIAGSPTGLAEGSRLASLRAEALDTLADAELALGHDQAVIARVEALVVDDPLRERRWAQLMVALYRTGRQADALRAYQRARAALAELGIEPGPDLQRLESAVLAHDPSLDVVTPRAGAPGGVGGPGGQGDRPPRDPMAPHVVWVDQQLEVPLIGRQAELARLVGRWRDVNRLRTGGVVFIDGDQGVGKTRLAAELADLARREGGRVVAARCAPGAGLSALLPAASAVGVPLPAGDLGPGSPATFEFAGQVAGYLFDTSLDVPLLLVLDDAQWAGAETITLFRQMGNRPLPMTQPMIVLALVLTQRGYDSPPGLAELHRHVERLDVNDRMVVEALGPAEGRALLVGQLGTLARSIGDTTLDRLVSELGGNPRALVEYAAHLSDGAAAATAVPPTAGIAGVVAALGVPHSLRLAVDERLDAQAPDVVAVVLTGALIGPTFTLARVARGAGLGEDDALAGLEQAMDARLVEEGPAADTYRFLSEVDRLVALDHLSNARRSRIEARLATGAAATPERGR